jgi:ABC-type transport system involved in multi-copper enzyme maturation permease subunit
MRLNWKDAWSTVLVVVGLAMALSVTQGWNWPLLGGVREAIIALGIAGLGACLLGVPRERSYFTDPFGLAMILVVVLALVIAIVGGLIAGSVEYLLLLMVLTALLWTVATFRHAVEGHSAPRIGTAA